MHLDIDIDLLESAYTAKSSFFTHAHLKMLCTNSTAIYLTIADV